MTINVAYITIAPNIPLTIESLLCKFSLYNGTYGDFDFTRKYILDKKRTPVQDNMKQNWAPNFNKQIIF